MSGAQASRREEHSCDRVVVDKKKPGELRIITK